ncbi:MAG: hypothetical protein LBG58_01325 [Planctomycetaceae bacterium]|jgi:hypothetical protein|nr:hypothetical protein [Planctomycetaceae bacterium]
MKTIPLQSDTLSAMKTAVIRRIEQINDQKTMTQIVNRLNEIIPEYPSFFTPQLIDQLNAGLEQGRKDYAEGRYTEHEIVMTEMDQWFEEN